MLNYSNSKVTMELRDVLTSLDANGQPFKLWDFEYPSYYKGDDKIAFEQKVIDHYLFHQIGVETIARFKHNFKTRIREIMPYYIQMYKSVEVMEGIPNPFENVDVTETFEQTSSGTSSGSSTSTESGTSSASESGTNSSTETANKTDNKTASEDTEHRFSNTPQGSIDNLDSFLTEVSTDAKEQTEMITSNGTVTTENESTGSSSSESTTTSSGSSASENSGTVKHTLTRKGNYGVNTYAHDMIEFRQSIVNVDMMVIDALRDLFLFIY